MNSRWLKNIFKSKGDISDIYVSYKTSKSTKNVFGFIHYRYKEDAISVFSSFNGMEINSNSMKVGWARYKRHIKEDKSSHYKHRDVSSPYNLKEELILKVIEEMLENFKKS